MNVQPIAFDRCHWAHLYRFQGMPLVWIYMGYLLIAAGHPFELSEDLSGALSQLFMSFVPSIPNNMRVAVLKFSLFIPLGVLLYSSMKSSEKSRARTILLVTVWGGFAALSLEFFQLFFAGRHPSAVHAFQKMSGAACGALLSDLCPIQVTARARQYSERLAGSNVFLCLILLYGTLPCLFFVARFPWFDFRNWDSRFTLQVGNEATGNRPWLGTIYRIAVYGRALSADEIAHHFHQGLSTEPPISHAQESLIALYAFNEASGATVHDTSTDDAPVHLTLSPRSHVQWLAASNGLEILHPAILRSQGPATKLSTFLISARSLSIEVWMVPADTRQDGPARIISYADHPARANFVLGQQGADVHFRLRTAMSVGNRSALRLTTQDGPLTSAMAHIVATYDGGRGALYVNGHERSGGVDLATDIVVGFAARKSALAQIAYSFFFFFPVAYCLVMFFSTRSQRIGVTILLSIVIAVSLLSLIEIFQAFAFDRALDLPLIGYGLLVGTLGAFSSKATWAWRV